MHHLFVARLIIQNIQAFTGSQHKVPSLTLVLFLGPWFSWSALTPGKRTTEDLSRCLLFRVAILF